MRNTHIDNVKEEILTALTDGPLTLRELETRLNRPYNTIQKAHQELRNEDKVTSFDRRVRNGRWALGQNNGPKSTIPHINFGGQFHKMTAFRGTETIPSSIEGQAHNVLKAWVTIAMTAQRLEGGIPNELLLKRLKRQQVNLQKAREAFEAMAFFCNQMLENPKFWHVEYLDKYPNDTEWAEFLPFLETMYDYYYKEEKANDSTQ